MPEPTAEQLARESGKIMGDSIADALENTLLKMVDAIAKVQAEQAELRDDLHTLALRVEDNHNDATNAIRETREAFPESFA